MKLHLPTPLRAALMATFAAVVSLGSAASASTTYDDLTTSDYFEANPNVYNTGKGTFYLETPSCDLNLTLTLNLNALNAYQEVHDYANGGYYSPFVTWTYNNNPGATYGMADVARGYSGVDYDSGFTGYWAGKPWTTGTKITTETLWSNFADADGNVTLTINNSPVNSTRNVVVTATDKSGSVQTLYSVDGLRSGSYVSQNITSFTVNTNYVTSVTLNTTSTLNSSSFTPPKDYSIPFESQRTDGTSVGRVLFLGDSITHGVEDMSYRWDIFKTLVDNGIEYEIAGPLSGYHSQPLNSDFNGDFSTSQYGGETYVNAHYAQSSGRTHNMLMASNSVNALGNGTGVNYGGVSSTKTGKDYNADTYVMMMGTNDILSDGAYNNTAMPKVTERLLGAGSVQNGVWVNADQLSALIGAAGSDPETAAFSGKWGTMGQIIDNMKMDASDTMYIVSIPTWGEGRTGLNGAASYVAEYNVKLEKWVDAYNASHTGTVKYVDVNKGLINVTRNGQFLAPDAFFRTSGGDYIHPNEQGALIVAGNLARGMGIAGRTAGLARSAADAQGWTALAPTINLAAGETQKLVTDVFTEANGYTIDFGAVFGNGATNGWMDKSNALSVSVGDGINTGTLNISEGYISWGDKLLYCQDNSAAGNENIRVAFHNGNVAENVAAGYYVWLGDMLIGQGLANQTGTLINGVNVSSVGSTATLTGFSYANTAYAPSTTYTTGTPYLVQQAQGNTQLVTTVTPLPSMESHDNVAQGMKENVTWKSTNSAYVNTEATSESSALKISNNLGNAYTGATNVNHTGSISVQYAAQAATNYGAIGVLNANSAITLEGDLYMEFSSDGTFKHWTGGGGTANLNSASVAGSYNGSITGNVTLVVNKGSFDSSIYAGAHTGNTTTIGGTAVYVNGGNINGSVFGGGRAGTINNDASVTVTGGTIEGSVYGGGAGGSITGNTSVTITGGVIRGSVNGGMLGGTEEGTVTVDGNKASIGGNITANTVTLMNVEDSGTSDGFDKYKGTITATNLVLDNYTAGKVNAKLVTDHVTASNGTIATLHNLTLRNCSIDARTAENLTLADSVHSGNTISYSGDIRLEDGITFTIDTPTAVTSGEGFSGGYYVYQLASGQTGSLLAGDGSALTDAHTATFSGTDKLAGMLFSYESSTGALIAHSSTATYNITTSTVNYSGIASAASISMSGGQLNLDTDLKAGATINATGGKVNINEGVTLNKTSLNATAATALTGEGTYATTAWNLGTNVSLDSAWTGTVSVTTNLTTSDASAKLATFINGLANDHSKVGLHGVSGWLDGDVTRALVLTGTAEDGTGTAIKILNGASGSTRVFSSTVEGTGDFEFAWSGENNANGYGQGTKFSGDISGWTGKFVTSGNATNNRGVHLDFAGEATTINAGVTHGRKAYMTLNFQGDSEMAMNGVITKAADSGDLNIVATQDVAFNNSVSATSLSAAGQTIVLGTNGEGESATHGLLSVSGTATVGTLRLEGGSVANGTIVTVNDAIQLAAGSFLNAASVAAGTDKTPTLSGAGTFVIDSVLNNAGTAQTLPAGISLSESDWQGVVRVNGGTMHLGQTIAALGSSWVELSGVSGKLGDTTTTYAGNIILTNTASGAPAMTISSSSSVTTATLSGTIKGDGDIFRTIPNGNNLTFSGDISEWTGTYYNGNADGTANPGWNTVNFRSGETINASFVNNAKSGACHLTLNFAGDTTVNGSLSTKTQALNVNVGGTATFNNTASITSLSANGKTVTVGSHGAGEEITYGALTVSGTATVGTMNVNAGTSAEFNGSTTLNSLNVGEGATVTLNGTTTIHNNSWNDSGISAARGTLVLAEGKNLNADGSAEIGTLVIAQTASYNATHNQDFTKVATIHNLQSEQGATLSLVRDFEAGNNTTYILGGANSSAALNTFDGTIRFDVKSLGSGNAQMVLANTDIAANAVLELNNKTSKTTYVGINAPKVKVAGIADAEGSTGVVSIYSGNTGNDNINGTTDGTVRTLEITGSGKYTTSAKLGANLNLLMSGTGTQTFTGDMSAFNGSVTLQSGTVEVASNAALGTVNMNGGSLSITSGSSVATTIYSNTASVLTIGTEDGVGSATLSVDRIEMGDNRYLSNSDITIHANGSLLVTGSTNNVGNDRNSGYKTDSLLLGEWNTGGTVSVAGKLIADGADMLIGDTDNDNRNPKMTLNITGGTVAVHGIDTARPGRNNDFVMDITDGGRLILGADGYFTRTGASNTHVSTTITDGTIGISADQVVVNRDMAIGNVTFDTQKYAVSTANGGSVAHTATEGAIEITGALTAADGVAAPKMTVTGGGSVYLNTDTVGVKKLAIEESSMVQLKQGAEVTLTEIVLGNGASLITNGELVAAMQAGDPTPYSGGTSAEVTVSGTAGEHAKLQATGDTTVATNLTLGSNVDMVYSNATQGINLAEHSLTLSAGETTIYLSDEMLVTLNNTQHLVLFSNVSELNLVGITMNPVAGNEDLFITPAGQFFANSRGEALAGQFQLAYNVATQEVFLAPEPATATLSLLALTALAARRRRK